jgi:hypothetical protein
MDPQRGKRFSEIGNGEIDLDPLELELPARLDEQSPRGTRRACSTKSLQSRRHRKPRSSGSNATR